MVSHPKLGKPLLTKLWSPKLFRSCQLVGATYYDKIKVSLAFSILPMPYRVNGHVLFFCVVVQPSSGLTISLPARGGVQ